MSALTDWLTENMHQHGETRFDDLREAFLATLPSKSMQVEFGSRGRMIQELLAAGYTIKSRAERKDRPYDVVVGVSFAPPPVTKELEQRILAVFYNNIIYRYSSVCIVHPEYPTCRDDALMSDHWLLTVTERPDYTPERYKIPFGEIAERASQEGISADARVVRTAFLQEAEFVKESIAGNPPDGRYSFYEDHEDELNKRVRCMAPDGIVGFRWRLPGEPSAAYKSLYGQPHDYYGPYLPVASGSSQVTTILPHMHG